MSLLSGICSMICLSIGSVLYIRYLLQEPIQDSRVLITWFSWGLQGAGIAWSYGATGGTEDSSIWGVLIHGIAPCVIFVLAFAQSIKQHTPIKFQREEYLSIGYIAIGFFTLHVLHSPLLSLILFLSIDYVGSRQLIRTSWEHPGSEPVLAWTILVCGNLLLIGALDPFTFSKAITPIYFSTVAIAIWIPTVLRVTSRRQT